MGNVEWFFVLDLQRGFLQLKMNVEDIKKMVLITKFGLYEWLVMPFGLKNALTPFFAP
jgi:hypothetical protein